jgi:3D (Asp-Asp-Asp) domain-containing protein
MSKTWLYDASNSNIFKQSYMKGFLDISGDLYVRNGSLIATNDISMNGNVSCNTISLTVPFSSSGINSDVSGALALKQNTLIAGAGITIDGSTINASSGNTISTITNDGSVINIASDLNVSDDLNVSGNITHNGQLLHTSDDRLKDNERRIENALETLNKLKPVKYNINNKMETGFIAQDVWYNAFELRHLVETSKTNIQDISGSYTYETNLSDYGWCDEPATLNYIGLIGYITKSIQELDILLENNKNQILHLT